MYIDILYKDVSICICVKQPGILSEGVGMPVLLKSQLGVSQVYAVHRLDQCVGGVMVYALDKKTADLLTKMFSDGLIKKEYLAVCSPSPSENEGIFSDYLYHDKCRNKTYIVSSQRKGVKKAQLAWITQESIQLNNHDLSLVRIALHTGRSHQIRVQFASRKFPLVGDGKYGSRLNSPQIGLWSYGLSFRHPVTGCMLDFYRIPPKEKPWIGFSSIHDQD